MSISVIFHEECARYPSAVASKLCLKHLERTLQRDQTAIHPGCPDTLLDYADILRSTERYGTIGGHPFFKQVIGNGVTESVVFAAQGLYGLTADARELHMDGTFKVLPKKPKCYQLFTISLVHHEFAIPAIFVVMSSKKSAAYEELFTWLKATFGGLRNVATVMSDFESGLRSAVWKCFPGTKHFGCWFHFCQAIFMRVKKTRTLLRAFRRSAEAKRCVHMLMALALAPPDKVPDGFEVIK